MSRKYTLKDCLCQVRLTVHNHSWLVSFVPATSVLPNIFPVCRDSWVSYCKKNLKLLHTTYMAFSSLVLMLPWCEQHLNCFETIVLFDKMSWVFNLVAWNKRMVLLVPFHIVVTKHPMGSNLKKDEVLLACDSKGYSQLLWGRYGGWSVGWLISLHPRQEADSKWEVEPEQEVSKATSGEWLISCRITLPPWATSPRQPFMTSQAYSTKSLASGKRLR